MVRVWPVRLLFSSFWYLYAKVYCTRAHSTILIVPTIIISEDDVLRLCICVEWSMYLSRKPDRTNPSAGCFQYPEVGIILKAMVGLWLATKDRCSKICKLAIASYSSIGTAAASCVSVVGCYEDGG